jgi:hypothetical protein
MFGRVLGRGAALAAMLGWACAPTSPTLAVDGASADARVIAALLDGSGEILAVAGPSAPREGLLLPIRDDARALVAFALEPDDFRGLDGAPLPDATWAALRVERASESACGCAAPGEGPRAWVTAGDRCAPPPFARAQVTSVGDASPAPEDTPRLIDAARRGLRLAWPGACAAPAWSPLAEVRAPLLLCPWLPLAAPSWVESLALAPDGAILALSRTGVWWTQVGPAGGDDVTHGLWPLADEAVVDVVAVDDARWLVLTRDARGLDSGTLHVLDRKGRLQASFEPPISVSRLAVSRAPTPRIVLLGVDKPGLNGDPLGALAECALTKDRLDCRDARIDTHCRSALVGLAQYESVGSLRAAWGDDGALLLSRADAPDDWVCVGPAGPRYSPRGGGAPRVVQRVEASYVDGTRVWACAYTTEGTALLTADLGPVGSSTTALPRFAPHVEVELIPSTEFLSLCRGFVRTASGGVALVGDERLLLGGDGSLGSARSGLARDARDARPGVGLVNAWRDQDRRVFRLGSDGVARRVLGEAEPQGEVVSMARVGGELHVLRVGSERPASVVSAPFAAWSGTTCPDPPPSPRTRTLVGGDALAGLRAWTSTGAEAWAFGGDPLRWVRVDLTRAAVEALPVEPPEAFAFDGIVAMAPLGPELALVVLRSGEAYRVVRDGARARALPVAWRQWVSAETSLPPRWGWRMVAADAGVAWLVGNDVLARVTAADAELGTPLVWPFDAARPTVRPWRTTPAGLVVLGPAHVLTSYRHEYRDAVTSTARLRTHELAPADRPCDGPLLTDGLRACIFGDGRDDSNQTGSGYAPVLGMGPASDPVLVNRVGQILGPRGPRGGVGFPEPRVFVAGPGDTFAVSSEAGAVLVGRRGVR